MIVALSEENGLIWSTGLTIKQRDWKFRCPACHQPVLLRQGMHVIPHFAHKKHHACTSSSDPESEAHLSGKIAIFDQMRNLVENAYLERYLTEIHQKADIYIEDRGNKYAIEFQCSPLSLDLLHKRTAGYNSIHVTPIWIFSRELVRQKGPYIWECSKMVQATINRNGQLFLYNSHLNEIIVLSQIIPFSRTTFFANTLRISLKKIRLDHFTKKSLFPRKYLSNWQEKRRNHLFKSIRFEGLRTPFYRIMYEKGYTTFVLPTFVGVPTDSCLFLRTPPLEWQGYLYFELERKNISTIQSVYIFFMRQLSKKLIEPAIFLSNVRIDYKAIVIEYIQLLIKIGYLENRGGKLYRNSNGGKKINEKVIYKWFMQQDKT